MKIKFDWKVIRNGFMFLIFYLIAVSTFAVMIHFENDLALIVYIIIMFIVMFVAYRLICPDEFKLFFKSPVRIGK